MHRSIQNQPFRNTFFYRPLAIAVLSLWLGGFPAAAATDCNQRCEPLTGDNVVGIDANTFQIDDSSELSYSLGSRVTLSIFNKNPFANTYELEIEAVEVELATIREALQLILPGFSTGQEQEPADPAPADSPCTLDLGAEQIAMIKDLRDLTRAYNRIIKGLAVTEEEIETIKGDLAAIKAPISSRATCVSICQKADGIPARIDAIGASGLITELETMEKLERKIDNRRAVLEARIERLPTATQEGRDAKKGCQQEFAQSQAQVSKASDLMVKAEAEKTKLDQTIKELKAAKKQIETVLANPDAFVERRPLPARSGPTRYNLSLECDPLDGGDSKAAEVGTVQIGSNRFSVSAGVGISFVEEQAFGRHPTVGEDGTTVSTFAVTETSDEHLAGVLQLNARIKAWGNTSFAWSLGAGISDGDTSTEINLYTGPSLSVLDDKLFFTLAFHQRSVEELSGFEIGDTIPADVMDPLPTRKEDKGGLLLTITYRFN